MSGGGGLAEHTGGEDKNELEPQEEKMKNENPCANNQTARHAHGQAGQAEAERAIGVPKGT